MNPNIIRDPESKAIVKQRYTVRLSKIFMWVSAALSAACATGFGDRFPSWLAFAIMGVSSALILGAGYLRQWDLPPLPGRRDE